MTGSPGSSDQPAALSEAQLSERHLAGRASALARAGHRHGSLPVGTAAPGVRPRRAEEAPGALSPPSRRAISLFRQGQARPDTRARRSVWDTRATEAPIGSVQATFKLHFPKALRSAPSAVAPPTRSRVPLAQTLAARRGHQDLVIMNPATIAEAHRHPLMRELIHRSIGVVRDNQTGTIEQGHARNLIPPGTPPGITARAFKHAALLALHKAGLGDYDFHMDEAAKAEFRPLVRFMRYAHRRVFDQLNIATKGKWQPFRSEFGQLYEQKKDGKLTGRSRMRMRPNQEFVKIDLGSLDDGLWKGWTNSTGVISAPGRGPTDLITGNASNRVAQLLGGRNRQLLQMLGGIGRNGMRTQNGHDAHSGLANLPGAEADRAAAWRTAQFALAGRLGLPNSANDLPPTADPATHLKDAAVAIERHLQVPRIGGMSLRKFDLSFMLGDRHPRADIIVAPVTGDYNTSPELQLKRAMHPRLRRKAFRLRLNTQKNLRRVLSGGITRQERWQLGATVALPKNTSLGKRLLTEAMVRAAARSARPPTEAQANAGNYRMGHTSVGGMGITIETPRGQLRRGIGRNGKPWSVRMPAHYGYIKRTVGADGDHLDVYLGPHAHEAERHPVFVVNQQDADTGAFDEHKALVGFRDRAHATRTYDAGFSDGRGSERRGSVHRMPFATFKRWTDGGDTTRKLTARAASLGKGILADAVRVGSDHLAPLMQRMGQSTAARGARSGLGVVARHPKISPVLRHPRFQAARRAATEKGAIGILHPAYTLGRAAGAALGGERGARIGGATGVGIDYAPYGIAGAQALGDRRRRTSKPMPPTLTEDAETKLLGKGIVGGGARLIGRFGMKTKLGLAFGAGAAYPAVHRHLQEHPEERAVLGAVAGGAAAAALSRGHAIAGIRRATRALYHSGMKDALREHLRVLAGGTPSPGHIAAQRDAARRIGSMLRGTAPSNHITGQNAVVGAIRRRVATETIARRKTLLAGVKASRRTVVGGAAAGGGAALALGGRNAAQWQGLPDPNNP